MFMSARHPLSIKITGDTPGEDAPGARTMSKRYSLDLPHTGYSRPGLALGIEKLRVLIDVCSHQFHQVTCDQLRVMRVIAGNFSTNVEKVSKEEIHVYVYGWKPPRHYPHHPQSNLTLGTIPKAANSLIRRESPPLTLAPLLKVKRVLGECL